MACSQQFSVVKSDGELVLPSKSTPTHTLPLSWFDKLFFMMDSFAEMFLVYNHGEEPGLVIKQALAKVLVPYYPLAGRIKRSELGANVACTGEGVWFVEAIADCSLKDITGLLVENCTPEGFPRDHLLPSHPQTAGMSLMLQVTQFACGGFLIGIKYDHIMTDGAGVAQIMKAIADIARGLKQPLVEPLWSREHVPSPPIPSGPQPPRPPQPTKQREYLILDLDISQDHINQLKTQFTEHSGESCTTFDVIVAKLWQCRIRAIGLDSETNIGLLFMANTRTLLSQYLPDGAGGGYYGNCLYPVTVSAISGNIAESSIAEIVSLIKDAKKRLPVDFSKWAEGDLTAYSRAMTMVGYDSTNVTDWRRLGFSDIDFGWGGPSYYSVVPSLVALDFPPACVMVEPPTLKEGCRLLTRCVQKEHSEAFWNQIKNFSKEVKTAGTD